MFLKTLRVILATLVLCLLTLFFVDVTGNLPLSMQWLAVIQFVPAILSGSLVVLLLLVLLSLLFGRIYCSVICPLGIFQDLIHFLAGKFSKKRRRHSYSPAKTWLRWGMLGVVVITFLVGSAQCLALLDPYSAYGRMINALFRPVYVACNNLLARIFTSFENYSFYHVDLPFMGTLTTVVASLTLSVVGFLAWRNGRTWCNTICPVGTLLGLLSRVSMFKPVIDTSKCNRCGACAAKCKASCIDKEHHTIDYSRCVVCFDCLKACRPQAIAYRFTWKKPTETTQDQVTPPDASRRRFLLALSSSLLLIPKLKAEQVASVLSGTLTPVRRQQAILPPGAVDDFHKRCTACHLCVSKCPSKVLRPATNEYGLNGLMQPTMVYDKGYCNYDCTICSQVCPNQALRPLSEMEKHRTQVGKVVFLKENCIVTRKETSCGACSEHCPTQALKMVPYKYGLTIPQADTSICVGCGGCEFICPARPYKAVYIEGHATQQEATLFEQDRANDDLIDDFGF